ncbi:MAG TPA: hypothetical protein GXZ70_02060 [Clostridiales bacterium]|nr:hypothetical protein [Clostridiales bacterium]
MKYQTNINLKEIIKNRKTQPYQCCECNKTIKNFYDFNCVYKDCSFNIGKTEIMCPYCAYKLLRKHLLSKGYSEEELKEMESKIDKPLHNNVMVYSHPEEVIYRARIVFSENNCAMTFWEYTHDDFLLSHDGVNPLAEYYFYKEVYERFTILETYSDYQCKLTACIKLKEWEDSFEYDNEIEQYSKFILENFTKETEDDIDIISDKKQQCYLEMKGLIDGYFRSSDIKNRIELLQDFFTLKESYIEEINKMILKCPDYPNPPDMEIWFDKVFYFEDILMNFEYWKAFDDYSSLLKSLVSLNTNAFYYYQTCLSDIELFKVNEQDDYLEVLEKMTKNFIKFYDYYEDRYSEIFVNIANNNLEIDFERFMASDIPREPQIIHFEDPERTIVATSSILHITLTILPHLTIFYLFLEYLCNSRSKLKLNDQEWLKINKIKRDFNYRFDSLVANLNIYKDKLTKHIKNNNLNDNLIGYTSIIFMFLEQLEILNKEEGLNEKNIEDIFRMKEKVMATYLPVEENSELEELLNRTFERIIDLIFKCVNDTDRFINKENEIKHLLGTKYRHIEGSSAFKSLVTAEYLYDLFIKKSPKELDDKKDYSCISIMYYKSLEDALNQKIFSKYKEYYLIPNGFDGVKQRNYQLELRNDYNKYLPGNLDNIKKYYYYWDNIDKVHRLVKDLTIGSMAKFLLQVGNVRSLKEFMGTVLRKDVDVLRVIQEFGRELYLIKDNRNDAAHGGTIINSEKVQEDKKNVFILEQATEYKRLLYKLLDILD